MKSANAAEKARYILESKQTVLVFGGVGRLVGWVSAARRIHLQG